MNCREVKAEIELYVIGALSAAEMSKIEQHLKECEDCRAALESYSITVEALDLEAANPEDFEPPAGHTARFMEKLKEHPQLRPGSLTTADLTGDNLPVPQPEPIKLPQRKNLVFRPLFGFSRASVIAGVLLVLVIALVVSTFYLSDQLNQQQAQVSALSAQLSQERNSNNQLNSQLSQAGSTNSTLQGQVQVAQQTASALSAQLSQQQTELASLRSQINSQQSQNAVFQQISLLLNEDGATTRRIQSNQVEMNVLMVPQDKQLALFLKGFSSTKSGTVYQLWLYKGNQLERGPSFTVSNTLSDGTAAITLEAPEPMSNYTAILITIDTGNSTPTAPNLNQEIISGKLSA